MQTRRDLSTDLAIGLLLGVGAACWSGLVLAELDRFRLLPVVVLGVGGLLAPVAALRRFRRAEQTPAADGGEGLRRWRMLDGPVVFMLALLLYAPGYDTTLFGSDATAYLANGAHLARTGSLAIDDPLLRVLKPWMQDALFPAYSPRFPDIRQRSPAGLTYTRSSNGTVYSAFAKFPSVWLAIGFAVAGTAGAILTSPLLGAGGVMAFYLFVRRTVGTLAAVVSAGLLAPSLPQLLFARVSLGEIGGQFFLWSGLLALSRWYETRAALAAVAAGVGLGLAALARVEFLLFLPLAGVVGWLLGARLGLSRLTVGVVTGLLAHAVFLLATVPSHYQSAIPRTIQIDGLRVLYALQDHPWAFGVPIAVLAVVLAWGAVRLGRRGGFRVASTLMRIAATAAVVVWGFAYAYLSELPLFISLRLLPQYTGWPVLVLAMLGVPLLARAWWKDPAGRLALLVCAVAACHFLCDPHAVLMLLWVARRFVPAVLPLLFAAAGMGVAVATARLGRVPGAILALVVLATNLPPARRLWGMPYFEGTGAAVAGIAAMVPEDAVVLIDSAFSSTLLDTSLWLIHGPDAVQLKGVAGNMDFVRPIARRSKGEVYLVRHGLLQAPQDEALEFTPVGEGAYAVTPLGEGPGGSSFRELLAVRVFRVKYLGPWR